MSIVTDHPLATGFAPTWASEWGHDENGPWVALHIGDAEQILRWIPPGQFMMGSDEPDPEWEWTANECPRHWVTISRGFWMFDTPVTQDFWEAVMDENPSKFKGSLRPVEQVSWNDTQRFIAQVNERVASLNLRLPTEAEWEYACRAGTETSRYGELEEIAWYVGNSGSETHEVKQKAANPWGLFDTLGNVWEWCQDDAFREYSDEPIVDPVYDSKVADRVIRGGSWGVSARGVRAAYRSYGPPDDRRHALGFRCLSSSEPSKSSA